MPIRDIYLRYPSGRVDWMRLRPVRFLGWKTDDSTLLSAEISPRQIAVRNHNAVESRRTKRGKSASMFCLFKSHRLRDHGESGWKQEIICLAKSALYSLPRSQCIYQRCDLRSIFCDPSDNLTPFPAVLFMDFFNAACSFSTMKF